MTDAPPPLPPDTLGYARNIGGLNNQKLALFGLFLKAIVEGPRRIVLPDFVQFDMASFNHHPVPIGDVLDLAPLRDFAKRHGLEIFDRPAAGDPNGWDFFHHGEDRLAQAAAIDAIGPGSLVADFFRALVPHIQRSPVLARLQEKVFGTRGIRLVAQLRIENDWPSHVTHRLRPSVGDTEDNAPGCVDIVGKIRTSLPDAGEAIYVVADEGQLPAPKEVVRASVRDAHGVELIWKSDILDSAEMDGLSPLERSMLDFEMAVAGDLFVGTSRSPFSSLAALERHARNGAPVSTHYVYNRPGPALACRTDHGAFVAAALATASDPWDPAVGFHLGRVLQAVGDRQRALEQFSARAVYGGDNREEVYLALLLAAQMKAELGVAAPEVIDTYRRAGEAMPERAEAWHAGARHARNHKLFAAGYELAAQGIDRPCPAQGRFVDPPVYEWMLLDEYAVCASWTGRHLECLRACQRLLSNELTPAEHRPRLVSNIAFCADRLQTEQDGLRKELDHYKNVLTGLGRQPKTGSRVDRPISVLFVIVSTSASQIYTEPSIKSLTESLGPNYNPTIVVIDNDGTLENLDNASIVRNPSPKTFAQNANFAIGLSHATQTDLILCNNDIIYSKSWFKNFYFASDRITIPYCNQDKQYSLNGIELKFSMSLSDFRNGQDALNQIATNHNASLKPRELQIDPLMPFYCAHIPVHLSRKVGFFDEDYGRGGGEDVDYRLRTILAGFDVVKSRNSYVLHFLGRSTWRSGESFAITRAFDEEYRRVFELKWGKPISDIFLAGGDKAEFAERYGVSSKFWSQDYKSIIRMLAAG